MKLAANQEGLPEGELAGKIARNLMQKHAISMRDVKETSDEEKLNDEIIEHQFSLAKKTEWRQLLLDAVCDHCDCRMVVFKGTSIHRIFGYRINVEMALYLFDVTAAQLSRMAEDFLQKTLLRKVERGKMTKQEARHAQKEFLLSAIHALRDKFSSMREEQGKENPKGEAIVLYRMKAVDQFYFERVGEVDEKCVYCQYSASGYQAGWDINVSRAGLNAKIQPDNKTQALVKRGTCESHTPKVFTKHSLSKNPLKQKVTGKRKSPKSD